MVNGFDRRSDNAFNADEARRFPWIRMCLDQLTRHPCDAAYDVLVWDNSFLPEHLEVIESDPRVQMYGGPKRGEDVRHGRALERLLRKVPETTDYVVTLDTDAFPIRDGWLDVLLGHLDAGAQIAGVWRDEMAPEIEPYVHPSCLAIRRETLLDLGVGFARREGAQDVGQNLTRAITAQGGDIARLPRSNVRNVHFLMAGIYGNLIYHQGAGSRHASFWTTTENERDEATRVAVRDAVFTDLPALVGFLTGELSPADAETRGLGPVVAAAGVDSSAE
jgi:hypothetical protein